VEADDLQYLLSAAGQRLLADAARLLLAGDDLATASRLRQGGESPAHVAAAMTQARLRTRAAEKFGAVAERMYFTTDGLEQATHPAVAGRRAARLADTSRGSVVDLCCGVGSDLLAFAAAGLRVTGVERDPVVAAIARANLAALGLAGVVETADAAGFPTVGHDAVFVDPARRDQTGRVFDPDRYSPPWHLVDALVRAGAIAKAAPGIPHELVPDGVEAEWVSVAGRLREATLWPADLAQSARRATVIRRDGTVAEIVAETATAADTAGTAHAVGGDRPARVGPAGEYLYEPDDAVVRAHLVAEFAAAVEGWLLDPHLAYVSAARRRTTPLGAAYRVIETLPYREKALRAALRARDIGRLEIKKRGVAVTPEELRARLRLRGSASATLVLTRTPHGAQALLVEPLREN
jgi:SAM-dependent methyltransferase